MNLGEITGLSSIKSLWSKNDKVELSEEECELLKKFDDSKAKYNDEQLKSILDNFYASQNEENNRLDKIEAKANSLLGFTGIAATLVLGISAISDESNLISLILRVAVGICFLVSILLAIQATQIGRYQFARPNIDNLWDFTNKSDKFVWQEQAYDILYSYLINRHWINDKASLVIGAQIWLRNAIILLLVLSISMALLPADRVVTTQNVPGTTITPSPTVTVVQSATPTMVTMTSTAITVPATPTP